MRSLIHPRAALAALGFLLALVAVVAAPSAPAVAQDLPAPGDGFDRERVGDVGIDVFDLAFGPDSTLYATADDGPHRLDLTGGGPHTFSAGTTTRSAATGTATNGPGRGGAFRLRGVRCPC